MMTGSWYRAKSKGLFHKLHQMHNNDVFECDALICLSEHTFFCLSYAKNPLGFAPSIFGQSQWHFLIMGSLYQSQFTTKQLVDEPGSVTALRMLAEVCMTTRLSHDQKWSLRFY